MALVPCSSTFSPSFTCHHRSSTKPRKIPQKQQRSFPRRLATGAAIITGFVAGEAFSDVRLTSAFELRFTVPDQTPEEAYATIRGHAQNLLKVKAYIDSESWRQVQKELRKSSSYLKQDLYTVIQSRPGSERPQLRKLYSDLFNNVTRLDYAARSKDASLVQECYDNIVSDINEIFTRI